ncbi:MAG: FAD:protein FMN transferase [Verrucomicrobiota bacterium]
MPIVTLARHAMATRFEVVLHGESEAHLRAAAEEALVEVNRLENQLSLYRSGSEIAQLNARAAHEPVRVSPEVFALLQQAAKLSAETRGAFDITIAPLVRCWGFMGGCGRMPNPDEVETARSLVGMDKVSFDVRERTVQFSRPGVMLDLGAIGKGYAVERGLEILREAGVTSALLHGGTSTVGAIGHPPEAEAWRVAVDLPVAEGNAPLHEFALCDEALSVSAVTGRMFAVQDQKFGHVIDPRTGQPVAHAALAAVVALRATETDALSTALLTLGAVGQETTTGLRPGLRTLVVDAQGVVTTSG